MEEKLKEIFGEWVSFDRVERMLYSHDVANLPSTVEKMVRKDCDAVVQPENIKQITELVSFAQQRNIPVVPRGAATSGYGGVIPIKGGIVVSFGRMNKVISVDTKKKTVTVEPGIIWTNLEAELKKYDLMLRNYPSSGPGATVGGWVAEGGSGIGSYEYGFCADNTISARVVTPKGEVKLFSGSELELINRAEGITGFIVEVTLAVRELEEEQVILAAFDRDKLHNLVATIKEVNKAELPLWHVSFATATFVDSKEEAVELASKMEGNEHISSLEKPFPAPRGKHLLMLVYPASREEQVGAKLTHIINKQGGELQPEATAYHEWEERFYSMRVKNLGPSLIPSEAIIPLDTIADVVTEGGNKLPGIAIEAIMANHNEVTLLAFLTGDERTFAYNIGFAKSLTMMNIAKKNGGRAYSVGLYFTNEAEAALGTEKLKRLEEYKKVNDLKNLFNPGKILASTGTPGLLKTAMAATGPAEPLFDIFEKFLSDKPKMKRKIAQTLTRASFACAQCGYCVDTCTLHMGYGWESTSPRGKFYILRQYLKGNLKINQEIVDKMLMCTTCKRCNAVCQVNLPIMELWDILRPILTVEMGRPTYPAFEMMGASIEMNLNIWANKRENRDAWVPAGVKVQEKGELAYWAGCTASFVTTDVAENAVRILKEGGVEFTYLGKDEGCCGIPMLVAGKPDTFEFIFRNNMEGFKKRGVKRIVLSCPGCYVALSHHYPTWAKKLGLDWDIKISHISEITEELINDGKLKFKKEVNKKVTWHDSCHIGRHGGVYDPPRNVLKAIPGVEYVEMKHCGEDALCCGSVLTRIGNPTVSNKLGAMRVQEAADVKVDMMLATCPCCEVQLRVAGNKANIPIPVMDFSDIVVEALGYESKNTVEFTLEAWSVFEKAIEIMTRDGIVEMMAEMMPEVMEAMPPAMQPMMSLMKGLPGGPVQNGALGMMEKMVPMLMPMLLPGMMPKLMPKVIEIMKQGIPNMPVDMEEMLPEMLPKVMAKIMPGLLGEVAPLLAPHMTDHMRKEKAI